MLVVVCGVAASCWNHICLISIPLQCSAGLTLRSRIYRQRTMLWFQSLRLHKQNGQITPCELVSTETVPFSLFKDFQDDRRFVSSPMTTVSSGNHITLTISEFSFIQWSKRNDPMSLSLKCYIIYKV